MVQVNGTRKNGAVHKIPEDIHDQYQGKHRKDMREDGLVRKAAQAGTERNEHHYQDRDAEQIRFYVSEQFHIHYRSACFRFLISYSEASALLMRLSSVSPSLRAAYPMLIASVYGSAFE